MHIEPGASSRGHVVLSAPSALPRRVYTLALGLSRLARLPALAPSSNRLPPVPAKKVGSL